MIHSKNYLPALLCCGFSVLIGASANAEIIPDTTLSQPSLIKQDVLFNNIRYTKIDGGTPRESNLFHSFSQFDISEGQQVHFANPTGIINILARVTGGQASKILGTLVVAAVGYQLALQVLVLLEIYL